MATLEPPPKRDPVSLFDYEPSPIEFHNAVLRRQETRRYRVRSIRFPSIGDNGQPETLVRGSYYESKSVGPKPLVIVLPIWGGHEYPSKVISAALRRRSGGGVNVFLVDGEQFLFDWDALAAAQTRDQFLAAWSRGIERERVSVIDIRRIIDWATSRAEVDGRRIALVGFSHSAIVAALAAQHEPRLRAAVLVMGGARVHEVAVRCPLERSNAMRATATRDLGWSLTALEQALEPLFRPVDPATYPGRVDPTGLLVVEAAADRCMSAAGRQAFFDALGRPERISIDAGHHPSFLSMTALGHFRLRREIWRFLANRLEVTTAWREPGGEGRNGPLP